MTSPAYETILAYHQGSKHHFDRYAPSPGTMDWANQPNPFRFYDGAEQIPLPLTLKDPDCPYDDLYLPPEGKGLPLQISTLGSFLALSLGLSAWKVAGGARRWSLRINPSSGNLHPTEGHLILPALTGLAGGVFHYSPFRHGLERRSGLPSGCWASVEPHFGGPGFLLALTSIFWRESWKYGERAYRYCALDAGHALAAISFAARLHRWQATCLTGAGDEQIETILGFSDMAWATGGAEIPELICWISTVSPEHPVSQRLPRNWDRHFVGASFAGVPNPLSRQAVKWPVIDAVAEAGRKPETCPNPIDNHLIISAPLPSEPVDVSAAAILRRRRSAVSYNPGKSIAASVFFSIVSRTLFRLNAPPFGVGLSAPDVNLLIFVHRVDGLTPGLYFLGRALAAADRCRNAWRDGFLWTPSHSTLPLWLLKEMDVTFEAMKLSCHQEIAGNSAFAVAMIAPLKERLKQATHAYRRLYWECGMIGQVLYLEAEAHGIRGTGIGCFFDDPVHHLLGIKDDADQNLYHFTVGHPVEDIRLTTLPAYYHLNR